MGNSPTPPGLIERIMRMVDERIARFAGSGFLRNATISDGGLTIKGGFLRMLTRGSEVTLFYIGPTGDALSDGTPQQGWIVRRGDGTVVLDLYDADVADGQLNQALNWRDRAGNTVLADDTDGGEGLARPYLPGVFYPSRSMDWPASSAAAFENVLEAEMPKQHPRLRVVARGFASTAGTTGEVRCMVGGVQFGDTKTVDNTSVTFLVWGPDVVADIGHMDTVHIKIEARRTAGTGEVRVGGTTITGMQS